MTDKINKINHVFIYILNDYFLEIEEKAFFYLYKNKI